MEGQFKEKVALVTGGSSGIGRATALAFAREGANVVVADVADEGGKETIRLIKKAGGEAILVKCDVSKAVEVEGMINKTVQTYGHLDCAVNNAAVIEPLTSTVDCTEEDWNRTIDINLKGVWLCMKYEISQMLKQGGGAIVNTSSTAGLVASNGLPAYTASKHGIIGLTRTAALEFVKAGIRVNAVCPGLTFTPIAEKLLATSPEVKEFLLTYNPMKPLAEPEEIAMPIVWLCSGAASFVTGTIMAVDGGITAR